jgi:uncharacterized protein YkwD
MSLHGNWIDLLIILVLIYYASVAFRVGFFYLIADFMSFLLSLLISLRVYKFSAEFLKINFGLSASAGNALGFIATAILLEILFGYVFRELVLKLPKNILKSKFNKFLGLLPALGEGILLTAFLLTAVIAMPVRPDVKKAVSESKIGGVILKKTSGVEKEINQVFGGAFNDALTYFTIKPGSQETLKLDTGEAKLSIDETSEQRLFNDLNKERMQRGLPALKLNTIYRQVGREYARDMWERKYFSHYSPEGKSVGDRLDAAGADYLIAGENLALAPTEETAHTGLMNSEGHRANILAPEFKQVGIGVIDNGIYGKIFVQVFSD